jgi:HK97 family phage major capsid protein
MSVPLEPTAEEQALVAELRRQWRCEIEAGLEPFQKSLTALAQRTSRPPGFSLESAVSIPALSLSHQLSADSGFMSFLRANKTAHSAFATELRLPPSRKAGTPISGLSPTQHVGLIWGAPAFPLRLRTLMPVIPVTSGSLEWTVEQSFTPSAAVVAETALKPQMAATFVEQTGKCATIAQYCKVSVQSLADTPMLTQWLDAGVSYACTLKEEAVILNGDATATPAIQGLMQVAPAFAYTPATGDQGMDVIGHAIGQLMGAGYPVDGIVLNSVDYTAMRLLKTTIGSYIFVGTGTTGPDDESVQESPPLVWQVPTVISPSMPAGKFLVGSFALATALFSREMLNVQIAFQNEDDFIRNLVTLRGELRSLAVAPVPAGLLQGTLPAGSLAATSEVPAPHHPSRK